MDRMATSTSIALPAPGTASLHLHEPLFLYPSFLHKSLSILLLHKTDNFMNCIYCPPNSEFRKCVDDPREKNSLIIGINIAYIALIMEDIYDKQYF